MLQAKDRVKEYINSLDLDLQVIEFEEGSTKTAQMAADKLGVAVGQIAKSILFKADDEPVLIVTSGDVKVHTSSLKKVIGAKPKMAKPEECLEITGFYPGGLCPFALKQPIRILIDKSMGRFEKVYAAAGSADTAVPITINDLLTVTGGELVDVCRKE
ncbi:YbaK/EbsC family protein [Natranaerobius thermophilus]|uniref:YbaK/prolyl-tRNA synthetase associated region n=1 Tax=Natranaerobius thermophilus (strain ATCC BAA-1301 / DSM 18059 / JW/NM-WN-LF) TaxID=457570 RepID=B2A7N3_NATTJ|nr:YbaK/EbsC family protein [Natranaerobius thermophilus]ACB85740.1 YbaK/prolyl-tRNA synthetase associated region [Natranaerobius thermophilus JW/NM-WN-LF]